jgi:hypothetical protein
VSTASDWKAMRRLNLSKEHLQELVRVALMTLPALIASSMMPTHPYLALGIGFCAGCLLQSYLFPMKLARANRVFRVVVTVALVVLGSTLIVIR